MRLCNKRTVDEHKWIQNINKHIKLSEPNYCKIINMNLPNDVNVWFVKNMRVLNNLDKDTDEYIKKENAINEYIQHLEFLQNNDMPIFHPKNNIISNIHNSGFDDATKAHLVDKYLNTNHDDKDKTIEYINTALSVPHNTNITNFDTVQKINKIRECLDQHIWGQEQIKEQILKICCSNDKPILSFVGPAGVGKTKLAQTIALSMNLPFKHISMGCINDPNTLIGHSSTYVGSKLGLIASTIISQKCINGVILLDEIDKINNYDVINVLIHILDKTQNKQFNDMYMPEINIDLSKILFITTLNDISSINKILLDRLDIIHIKGYTLEEKIKISKQFLAKNISIGLIKYVIEKYDNVDTYVGIRRCKELFDNIDRHLRYMKCINKKRITLTKKMIDEILDNQYMRNLTTSKPLSEPPF